MIDIKGGEKTFKKNNNLLISITILVTLLFFITISSAYAADYTINNTSESINDATNYINAQTTPGNYSIEIKQGIYDKTTDINNNIIANNTYITITGIGDVTIDARSSGRMFQITGNSTLTFINIKFINGFVTGSNNGGTVFKNGNGSLSIINCTFNNNSANNGGAVYATSVGDFTVEGSVFENNIARAISGGGGAITLYQNNYTYDFNTGFAHYKITNSNFTNNTANFNGGAIYFQSGAYQKFIEIDYCRFINNSALYGGACSLNGGNQFSNVNNSLFENNRADKNPNDGEGGAIEANNNWNLNINSCKFINNSATSLGGAISNYYSLETTVINCSFINNTSPIAGAFYDHSSTYNENTNIINSSFIGHVNAILLKGNYATITGCNFTNNSLAINITGKNTKIIGSNFIDNIQGILINPSAINTTINYNRLFNNTGYDLNNNGADNTNADYNWWGNNTPSNYLGIVLNNYFVSYVTNITSLDSNGTVKFLYTFELSNGEIPDYNLLPYFITDVYTNITTGVVASFEAILNGTTFDVTVNKNGTVLYTFIIDNEIQTLEGKASIVPVGPVPVNPIVPDIDPVIPDVDPIVPNVDPDVPDVNPNTPDDPDVSPENVDDNKTNDNSVASAAMENTGLPVNLILLTILSVLGILITRKK